MKNWIKIWLSMRRRNPELDFSKIMLKPGCEIWKKS